MDLLAVHLMKWSQRRASMYKESETMAVWQHHPYAEILSARVLAAYFDLPTSANAFPSNFTTWLTQLRALR